MTATQSRVTGSNFTTFRWNGNPIAYLAEFRDSGQAPVAGPEPIHPLGSPHPVEVAVSNALGIGNLSFVVTELWNKPVWQHLSGLASAQNILDVWTLFRSMKDEVTCQMVIRNPNSNVWRTKTFHGVVITAIDDSEAVTIGGMTIDRSIAAMYTHATRGTIARSGG